MVSREGCDSFRRGNIRPTKARLRLPAAVVVTPSSSASALRKRRALRKNSESERSAGLRFAFRHRGLSGDSQSAKSKLRMKASKASRLQGSEIRWIMTSLALADGQNVKRVATLKRKPF